MAMRNSSQEGKGSQSLRSESNVLAYNSACKILVTFDYICVELVFQ